MVDGDIRAAAARRLDELKEQGRAVGGQPKERRGLYTPGEPLELEAQLSTIQATADGNWVLRFVCPARVIDQMGAAGKFYGWRLRLVVEVAPASWG